VIANLVYVIAGHWSDRSDPSPQLILMLIGQTFGAPALSIFYMTSLILLVQAANWEHRLQPLASVDRTAISNHLLQTLICTTLFYCRVTEARTERVHSHEKPGTVLRYVSGLRGAVGAGS
jgi:uncharacterized membrane protein YeiB